MRVTLPCRGWVLSAALVVAVLAAMLGGGPRAGASTVAYIDGNEVWMSSLDGKQKARLSSGEGDWRAVAAADQGRVLGVRLESGKISQISKTQLWDGSGRVISQGPLPYWNTAWSSYAAPVGLDLSSDGFFLAYGYSGYTGIVPNASFFQGHNVINADTKALLQPIGQSGYEWPSMFGRRVVAAAGSAVNIQESGSGPFGTTFNGLVDVSGTGLDLMRSDIAATGRLLAFELDGNAGNDKVGVVSISGVDPPVTVGASVDCFVPAVGDAGDVTFSQDGTRIAWQDDQGVKVAGVPTTPADPCVLSSPPVLISATGSHPSIGGADFVELQPPAKLDVDLPPKVRAADLAAPGGVTVTVQAPGTGKLKVTGTVPASRLGLKGNRRLVIITGSSVADKAGAVKVKLRLVAKYRKYRQRLKGATVRLKIVQGSRTITRSVKLR